MTADGEPVLPRPAHDDDVDDGLSGVGGEDLSEIPEHMSTCASAAAGVVTQNARCCRQQNRGTSRRRRSATSSTGSARTSSPSSVASAPTGGRCATSATSQYRGWRKFRDAWTAAGPNDRDGVLYDAKKHWGSHLHIPLTYRQIEDGVPKAIAQRPKLLYLPGRSAGSRTSMRCG
jgi:hypothetical protein